MSRGSEYTQLLFFSHLFPNVPGRMASEFHFKLPGVGGWGWGKHDLSDFFFLEQGNQDGHSNRQRSELLTGDGDDVAPPADQ